MASTVICQIKKLRKIIFWGGGRGGGGVLSREYGELISSAR